MSGSKARFGDRWEEIFSYAGSISREEAEELKNRVKEMRREDISNI